MSDEFPLLAPPRLIELGKIKIGGLGETRQKQGGGEWRLPRKDDHFTITTLNRGDKGDLIADANLMEELSNIYADPTDGKLRQIPVSLLSDNISEVLQVRACRYSGKALIYSGDGRTLTKWRDEQSKLVLNPPAIVAWNPEFLAKKVGANNDPWLKLHSTLSCVIAHPAASWGGVYKFRTTSVISAEQLRNSLLQIQRLTNGVLMGVPLRLVVRPVKVREGKSTVFVVHCEMRGDDLQQIQDKALDQMRYRVEHRKEVMRLGFEVRKLEWNPEMETAEEQSDIADEFSPDTNEPAARPNRNARPAAAPVPHATITQTRPEPVSVYNGSAGSDAYPVGDDTVAGSAEETKPHVIRRDPPQPSGAGGKPQRRPETVIEGVGSQADLPDGDDLDPLSVAGSADEISDHVGDSNDMAESVFPAASAANETPGPAHIAAATPAVSAAPLPMVKNRAELRDRFEALYVGQEVPWADLAAYEARAKQGPAATFKPMVAQAFLDGLAAKLAGKAAQS